MIDCKECRERLYPTDPRPAQYHKGKRYVPICETCDVRQVATTSGLDDRVNNLEAITAEPGGIPQWYHDQIHQMRNEITHWKLQVIEARPKKPKVPQRSTYKGLSSGS